MKILITSIGSAAAQFAISSYKKLGYKVIGTDIYDCSLLHNASLTDEFYKVSISAHTEKYLRELLDICKLELIDYIIPLTDPEVDILSLNKHLFIEQGTIICIDDEQKIRLLRNKAEWPPIFKAEAGIKTIPTFSDYEVYLLQCGIFPLIAKPSTGRSSQGFFKANHPDDLPVSVKRSDTYIFQPWLSGEVVVSDILADREMIYAIVNRKEWLRTKNGMGTSVELFSDTILNQAIHSFFSKISFKGVLNMEWLFHKGEYYLMDINPRISAGVAFSGLAGYDFAEQHLNLYSEKPCGKLFDYASFIAVKQYFEIVMT